MSDVAPAPVPSPAVPCEKCEGRGYGDDGQICVCKRRQMLNDLLPAFLRPVPVNQKFLQLMLDQERLTRLNNSDVLVEDKTLADYHSVLKTYLAYRVNINMLAMTVYEIDPSQLADIKYGEKKVNGVMVGIDEIFAADLVSLKLTWCTPNSTYEDLLMSLLSLRRQQGLPTWVWLDPTLQQKSKKFGEAFTAHLDNKKNFFCMG